MRYDYGNKQDINSIYVHDFVFNGFLYDYNDRRVLFECENLYLKKKLSFSFNNVILFDMQSCDFWHGGNRFYDIIVIDRSMKIKSLAKEQEQQGVSIKNSYIDKFISYISISFILVSGDVLNITCENMDVKDIGDSSVF